MWIVHILNFWMLRFTAAQYLVIGYFGLQLFVGKKLF